MNKILRRLFGLKNSRNRVLIVENCDRDAVDNTLEQLDGEEEVIVFNPAAIMAMLNTNPQAF